MVGEIFVEWARQGSPAEGELQMTKAWLETTSGGVGLTMAADPSLRFPVSANSLLPSVGTPPPQEEEEGENYNFGGNKHSILVYCLLAG